MKNVQIQTFSGPYFSVFSPNTGKQGPEKLRIWSFLVQRYDYLPNGLLFGKPVAFGFDETGVNLI